MTKNIQQSHPLSPIYENGVRIWNGGHFKNNTKLISLKMPRNYLYGVPLNSKTIVNCLFTYNFHL